MLIIHETEKKLKSKSILILVLKTIHFSLFKYLMVTKIKSDWTDIFIKMCRTIEVGTICFNIVNTIVYMWYDFIHNN